MAGEDPALGQEGEAALAASLALGERSFAGGSRPRPGPARSVRLVGDPQASRRKFFGVLEHAGLLGPTGFLREDVRLLSVGDHFDYPAHRSVTSREGLGILRWLAEHPREQVRILLGNHDVCRVMELCTFSDADFERAHTAAHAVRDARDESARVSFLQRFPSLPDPDVAARDFSSYSVAQRDLVQDLILAGRVQLAQAARTETGDELLITHAGVTTRELALLDVTAAAGPRRIAALLNGALDEAASRVRASWTGGRRDVPLDLSPLHRPGSAAEKEGGGLLYHRPASAADREDSAPGRPGPRRYHPTVLPRGLLQACGHTGHHKCLEELRPHLVDEAGPQRGGLRTLRVASTGEVTYRRGIHPPRAGDAVLYLCDGEMHRVSPDQHPLLALADFLDAEGN